MMRFLAGFAMMQRLALLYEMPRLETVHAITIPFQCTNFLHVGQ